MNNLNVDNKHSSPEFKGQFLFLLIQALENVLENLGQKSIGSLRELNRLQAEVLEKLKSQEGKGSRRAKELLSKDSRLEKTKENQTWSFTNFCWITFCLAAIATLATMCVTNAAGFPQMNFFVEDGWTRAIIFSAPFVFIPFGLKFGLSRPWVNENAVEKTIWAFTIVAALCYAGAFAFRFAYLDNGYGGGYSAEDDIVYLRFLFLSQVLLEIGVSTIFSLHLIKALEPKKNPRWLVLKREITELENELEVIDQEIARLRGIDADIDYVHYLMSEFEDSLGYLFARKHQ